MPYLAFLFGFLFFALLLWPKTGRWVESIAFGVGALEFVGRLAFTIIPRSYYIIRQLDYIQTFIWFPIIYLLAFITFPERRKMMAACVAIVLTVGAVLVIHFAISFNSAGIMDDFFQLGSFYLANIVFILLLGYSAKTSEQHTRWKVMAKTMADLANVDTFLEIPNRRFLESEVAQQVELANRYGQELSLLSFDLDNLKRINDRHGHLGGDAALKQIAVTTQELVRKTDSFGRWGGDEFLAILPHTDMAKAHKLAKRIQQALHNSPVVSVGTISASFGIAEFIAGETADDLLRRADKALYAAKDEKKARVLNTRKLTALN